MTPASTCSSPCACRSPRAALPGAAPAPPPEPGLVGPGSVAPGSVEPSRPASLGLDALASSRPVHGAARDADDLAFMQLAVRAGREGSPAPNPHVGAVVVQNGQIVGVGHHERAGEAHAEAHALARAGALARGATLYVTLEPCNHHGRTPPCVDAILASGVSRVVIGCADPNPHVRGGGADALRRAGLAVSYEPCGEEAERLIADWAAGIAAARRSLAETPSR